MRTPPCVLGCCPYKSRTNRQIRVGYIQKPHIFLIFRKSGKPRRLRGLRRLGWLLSHAISSYRLCHSHIGCFDHDIVQHVRVSVHLLTVHGHRVAFVVNSPAYKAVLHSGHLIAPVLPHRLGVLVSLALRADENITTTLIAVRAAVNVPR